MTRIRNAFLTLQESSAGEIKPLHSCKSSGYVVICLSVSLIFPLFFPSIRQLKNLSVCKKIDILKKSRQLKNFYQLHTLIISNFPLLVTRLL